MDKVNVEDSLEIGRQDLPNGATQDALSYQLLSACVTGCNPSLLPPFHSALQCAELEINIRWARCSGRHPHR